MIQKKVGSTGVDVVKERKNYEVERECGRGRIVVKYKMLVREKTVIERMRS